jgi:hypothetical protein
MGCRACFHLELPSGLKYIRSVAKRSAQRGRTDALVKQIDGQDSGRISSWRD